MYDVNLFTWFHFMNLDEVVEEPLSFLFAVRLLELPLLGCFGELGELFLLLRLGNLVS